MFTPFLENYAYGWGVGKIALSSGSDPVTIIAHGGGINGFNTMISRIVDDQHLVVLLNNTGGTNLNDINKAIRSILYELPYKLPENP